MSTDFRTLAEFSTAHRIALAEQELAAANRLIAEQCRAIARLAAAIRTLAPCAELAVELLDSAGEHGHAATVCQAARLAMITMDETLRGETS